MDGRYLSHVLGRGRHGAAEAEQETADHQAGQIGRKALDQRGDDDDGIAQAVDAASADHVSQGKKRCAHEVSDRHQAVDGANNDAGIGEAKVFVEASVGVDTTDDAPIHTISVITISLHAHI